MVRQSRRQFLQGGLALAGLVQLSGCGLPSLPRPPSKVARIGYLALARADDPAAVRALEAFQQGLRELGWIEGQDIALEYRSAEERSERLPDLAAELVRLPVDVRV